MARIFISYSSKSKGLVTSLAQDLELAGHQIWFDHKLTGGQAWWDQILENIRQCDLFIFALTPEALDSYPCRLEYAYAHQLGKNVLPVLVADEVPVNQLPPELLVIQFVDYRSQDKQAAFRLTKALSDLPAVKPLPDPLPEPPPVPISYIGNLKERIDSPTPLSFDEQAALVFKLKEHLREGENSEDVLDLLGRLKKREDLYAKIDKEIDAILSSATAASASSKPAFQPESRNAAASSLKSVFTPILPRAERQTSVAHEETRRAESKERVSNPILTPLAWQLIVSSGITWGVLGLLVGLIFLLPTAFFAIGYLIHGIVTGLVLRRIESSPQSPLTVGWIIKSALMGGPLNGLLLRRIVPSIQWWQIGLVAVGWITIYVLVMFGVRFRFYDIFGFDMGSVLVWMSSGGLGGAVTYGMYWWLRRSR